MLDHQVHADALDIVDGGVKPDRADDVRRARLEPRGRRGIAGVREGHLVDHRAAALPRRHAVQYVGPCPQHADAGRSEEHTSEHQSLMRISYAVFCLKKKTTSLLK